MVFLAFSLYACVTYHALCTCRRSINWGTLGGVPIAEAISPDDHVIEGVVVLILHLVAGVEQVVTQSVELHELCPEVRDLQHVCVHTGMHY